MKRKNVFMIILLTVLLAFGCAFPTAPTPEETEQQEAIWPLDGITLKKPNQPDVTVFPGTYLRSDDLSFSMEAVTLYDDGTAIGIPYARKDGTTSFKDIRVGTWAISEKEKLFALKFPNTIYAGEYLPYKSNDKTVGFGFNAITLDTIEFFFKLSDKQIDVDVYNNKSISGLYVAKDDYGDLYGMEFFEDGRMIFYSANKNIVNYKYKLSPGKPLLKTISESGKETEYNYMLYPATLVMNGAAFQKVR